jgi:peptide/nickel transport system substrate-binding protein
LAWQGFSAITQSRVFDVNARGQVFPEMATLVPTVKNGGIRGAGKTYVIHLKPGMQWSNGAEITSADARFGWKVDYESVPAYQGQPMCQAISGSCPITAVDTPDRYTIAYHLNRSDSSFLVGDLPQLWPVRWPGDWDRDPHAAMLKLTDPAFNFIGSTYPTDGPYQVARSIGDSRIDLRPMKYYSVMNCGGFIGTIVFRQYASPSDVLVAVATHEVDVSDVWNYFRLPQLEKSRSAYRIHVDPSNWIEHIEFNLDPQFNGEPTPLHDVRVRQALELALDKRALVENGLGLTSRQASNVIQWSFCINSPKYRSSCADRSITGTWDPIAHRYDPNPGKGVALLDAKRLLSSSRWPHGFSLNVSSSPDPPRLAAERALASSWSKLGVTVNVTNYPFDKLFGSWGAGGVLAHGQFQAAMFANLGSGTYPDTAMRPSLSSSNIDRDAATHSSGPGGTGQLANFSGIRDPVIDKALGILAGSLDPKVRAHAYAVIQEEMAKKAYWDVLYTLGFIYTEDGRVANLSDSVDSPGLLLIYWNAWAWKTKHR